MGHSAEFRGGKFQGCQFDYVVSGDDDLMGRGHHRAWTCGLEHCAYIIWDPPPEQFQRACKLIIDRQTRAACGAQCCLPRDHGPAWNHTCPTYVHLGSSFGYRMFMLLGWWQRVTRSFTAMFRMASRTLWKWSCCRWALGVLMLALSYTACAAPVNLKSGLRRLPRRKLPGLLMPSEQIAMVQDSQFALLEGYHKRTRIQIGTAPGVHAHAIRQLSTGGRPDGRWTSQTTSAANGRLIG